ncbi:MAG: hypothetical protein OER91_08835, partial [Gammaproteobacteria bacterium]|nr:hypothetical protein [Gammaproteobacteria bacterium]
KAADWLRGRDQAPTDEAVILGAPDADDYLEELYELSSSDPDKQADIFADADAAAKLTPGPSTNLRFGLVLATPGHAGTDPQRAQGLLSGVLAQSELLTAAEISLATIYLHAVEHLNYVSSEARSLYESTSRAARNEQQATSQRIAAVEEENRRLRSELADAEQKLEAITSIERSIREQE